MRNRSAGPLGAVVLFSGVLAVPLLAVFGVPQFAPVSASPGGNVGHDLEFPEHDFAQVEDDFPEFGSPPTSPRENAGSDVGWGDPFREQSTPAPPFESASAQPPTWSPPPDALGQWQTEQNTSGQRAHANAGGTIPVDFGANPPPSRRSPIVEAAAPSNTNLQHAGQNNSARQLERDFAWAFEGQSADTPTPPSSTNGFAGFDLGADSIAELRRSTTAEDTQEDADRSTTEPRDSIPTVGEIGRPADRAADTTLSASPSRMVTDRQPGEADSRGSLDQAPLTWRSAVARLNALGIRHFQLEPGETGGFLFSCSYTPGDNPRITRRFEAEAAEPLRAVERVLAQVEQWLHQQ